MALSTRTPRSVSLGRSAGILMPTKCFCHVKDVLSTPLAVVMTTPQAIKLSSICTPQRDTK